MTTSRMVVVLRSELGTQLSIAQKERVASREGIEGDLQLYARGGPLTREIKLHTLLGSKCVRLQTAIHALGALQLGDIEDKDI